MWDDENGKIVDLWFTVTWDFCYFCFCLTAHFWIIVFNFHVAGIDSMKKYYFNVFIWKNMSIFMRIADWIKGRRGNFIVYVVKCSVIGLKSYKIRLFYDLFGLLIYINKFWFLQICCLSSVFLYVCSAIPSISTKPSDVMRKVW